MGLCRLFYFVDVTKNMVAMATEIVKIHKIYGSFDSKRNA